MIRVKSSKIVDLPQEKVLTVIKDTGKLQSLFPDKYKLSTFWNSPIITY